MSAGNGKSNGNGAHPGAEGGKVLQMKRKPAPEAPATARGPSLARELLAVWRSTALVIVHAHSLRPRRAWLTAAIVVLLALVHAAAQLGLDRARWMELVAWAGMVPLGAFEPESLYRFGSHALIHVSLAHLLTNLAMFHVFARGAEQDVGWARLLVVVLVSIAAGAALHAAVYRTDPTPLVGFSGAASGVTALYLFTYRHARLAFVHDRAQDSVPVFPIVLVWFGMQFVWALFDRGTVSFVDHLGGGAGGALVGMVLVGRRAPPPPMPRIVPPPARSAGPPVYH